LIGLAAIPGLPLPLIGLLVLIAAFFAPPFEAAHASLLPRVLTGDRYAVGLSVGNAVHQSTQLAGFLLGGALVALVSAGGASRWTPARVRSAAVPGPPARQCGRPGQRRPER
jgi:hypothetical protein